MAVKIQQFEAPNAFGGYSDNPTLLPTRNFNRRLVYPKEALQICMVFLMSCKVILRTYLYWVITRENR
jgi:hypothetical protein